MIRQRWDVGWTTRADDRTTHPNRREGMMSEPILKVLTGRVERLERAARWWKHLASFMLALLGIAVLLGAKAGKKPAIPEELRAQRVVLVDKANKGRAALEMVSDNQPGLVLLDDAGRPRLTLSLTQYGEPTLSFADAGGTRRIVLGLDLYGTVLRFTDDSGNLRAALAVPSEGEPELELVGKDDKILWRAP
jgi:hypothetical protein